MNEKNDGSSYLSEKYTNQIVEMYEHIREAYTIYDALPVSIKETKPVGMEIL